MKPRTQQERNKSRRLAMESRHINENDMEKKVPAVVQDLEPILKRTVAHLPPEIAKKHIGKAISNYFANEVWSIEKEEWDKHMTPEVKGRFVNSFYNRIMSDKDDHYGPGDVDQKLDREPGGDYDENEEETTKEGWCAKCHEHCSGDVVNGESFSDCCGAHIIGYDEVGDRADYDTER